MDNINKIRPFGRLCVTLGMIPTSYKESMSYEEQLLWFCHFLETEIIPKYNENVEAINDLINLCNELKDYVEHYFDNLDVQQEINNKLDEMAESGELADIIAQYLGLAGVLAYDTIENLSEAVNITEGSICYVLGQLEYNDGKGGFYKIRTVTSGDVVDNFNIVSLDVSNTLVAERIPNFYINSINSNLSNLNEEVNLNTNKVNKMENNLQINSKFTKVENGYNDSSLSLTGSFNSLSFETFKRQVTSPYLTLQGQAFNQKDGVIYHNTNDSIYTLSQTQKISKTTIYSDDYGHGGDCCIYNNKMYISDSENNNIYIVDLSDGSKTTINLTNSSIVNEEHSDYVPMLAGIFMDETDDYCYICVCDSENNDHTVKTGSTVRFYKYDFDSTYTKLFEVKQTTCYVQGATQDQEYIYFAGNKPFTGSYSGNKLYIINKKDYSIFDILENNSAYEFEGLDYCTYHGVEGLLTACCFSSTNMWFGLYAFGGNCTETITLKDTTNEKAYSVKSRGGVVTTYIRINGTFTQDQIYTYNNFFDYNFPLKMGEGGSLGILFAVSYHGSNRNHKGLAEWDVNTNNLTIRTDSTTSTSDKIDLTFIYVSE